MRATDGREFAASSNQEIAEWVVGGKVRYDTPIWCDDWREWRLARKCFPRNQFSQSVKATPKNSKKIPLYKWIFFLLWMVFFWFAVRVIVGNANRYLVAPEYRETGADTEFRSIRVDKSTD